MGQQQLILLVLATIIVGLAIVVGIRAFNENNIKSNADAMIQDAVRIANDLQAWKQKPAPFGGQASVQLASVPDTLDYAGATFPLLGYAPGAGGDLEYVNLNGVYTLTPGTATSIQGVNALLQNVITVSLDGLSDSNVTGQIDCLGGEAASGDCTALP
jgi:hypothetical protein